MELGLHSKLMIFVSLEKKSCRERNFMGNRKGMMHMIEAVIAILMIVSFLLVLRSRLQPAGDTGLEQAVAAQALSALDQQNVLRSYAIDENHLGLNAQADQVVPAEFNHTTRFCYLGERCVGDALPDKNVFTASILIAGNQTYFKPAQVLLHIWR